MIPRMTPEEYYTRHERREPTTWVDWLIAAAVIVIVSVLGSVS